MIKKIFGDVAIYGIAPIFPKIAGFLVLPLITPFLTKEDFGVYGIIIAYTTLFNIFYFLGAPVSLANSFFKSRQQYKWLWRQVYGFLTYWNIVFAMLMLVILYFLMPEAAKEHRWEIIVLNILPIVFFGPTAKMASQLYQLKRKPIPVTIRTSGFGILNIILILLFIRYLKMGYMGWFWALFITQMLTNISWWFPLNRTNKITPIFNFKWRTIKSILKIGLPILPHQNALYILSQSDRIVMDWIGISTGHIGLYNVAYQGSTPLSMAGDAFTTGMSPHVIDMINKKKEKSLRIILFASQVLFFLFAILFACIAKEFFQFLFRNEEFSDVYKLAVLIFMSFTLKPLYIGANARFFYFEKTKSLAKQSFIAGALNIILNIIFIPIWGIEAAAVTTFIGYLFISFSRYYSKTYKEISTLKYYPTYWLLLSIMVAFACYYIAGLSLNLRISIVAVLLIIIFIFIYKYRAYIFKLIKRNDGSE